MTGDDFLSVSQADGALAMDMDAMSVLAAAAVAASVVKSDPVLSVAAQSNTTRPSTEDGISREASSLAGSDSPRSRFVSATLLDVTVDPARSATLDGMDRRLSLSALAEDASGNISGEEDSMRAAEAVAVLQKLADGLQSKLAHVDTRGIVPAEGQEHSSQQGVQLGAPDSYAGGSAPLAADSLSMPGVANAKSKEQRFDDMEPLRREWRKAKDTCDRLGRRLDRESDLSMKLENERLRLQNVTFPAAGAAPQKSTLMQQQLQRELNRTTRDLGCVMQQYRHQWSSLQQQIDVLEQHSKPASAVGRSYSGNISTSRSLTPTPREATPTRVPMQFSVVPPQRSAATPPRSQRSPLRLGEDQRARSGRQPHMPTATAWGGTRTPRREAPATAMQQQQGRATPRQWIQQTPAAEVAPRGRQPKMPSTDYPLTSSTRSVSHGSVSTAGQRARTVSPRSATPRGDEADEFWCSILQRFPEYPHWILLKERTGVYRMGNANGRTVITKVSNAGLQVRIGGGWMDAEAFLERYGPHEMNVGTCAAAVTASRSGEGSIRAPAGPPSGPPMSGSLLLGTQWGEQEVQRSRPQTGSSTTPGTGGSGNLSGSDATSRGAQITRSLTSMERLLAPTKSWARRIGLDAAPDLRDKRGAGGKSRGKGAQGAPAKQSVAANTIDVSQEDCHQNGACAHRSLTIDTKKAPHEINVVAASPAPTPMLSISQPASPLSPRTEVWVDSARLEPWRISEANTSVVQSVGGFANSLKRHTVALGPGLGSWNSSASLQTVAPSNGSTNALLAGVLEPPLSPKSPGIVVANNSYLPQGLLSTTIGLSPPTGFLRHASSGAILEQQKLTASPIVPLSSEFVTRLMPRSPGTGMSASVAAIGTAPSVVSVTSPRRHSYSPGIGSPSSFSQSAVALSPVAFSDPQFLRRATVAGMPAGSFAMTGASPALRM